jgi:parvulin-like peptidyl-prolyl isomerase
MGSAGLSSVTSGRESRFMTWHRGRVQAGVVCVLTVCGCMAGPPAVVKPLAGEPVASVMSAPTHEETATAARGQKPDHGAKPAAEKTTLCQLDLPLQRPPEAQQANPAATIVATVNGEPILDDEVKSSMMQAGGSGDYNELFSQFLDQLIDREVILQDAFAKLERGGPQGQKFADKLRDLARKEFEKRWLSLMMKQNHFVNEEELKSFLTEHHVSLDVIRRQWERNFMAHEYMLSRVEAHISRIGHNDIAEYYDAHREEFTRPDSVQWQEIFIDATQHASRQAARAFAESLIRRTRQGEDFAKLSNEFDNGTSGRYRQGEGQGHKHGEIFPTEAEPVLFRMHDGDIEIVERARGFHVIRLVKREHAGPIPFDDKVQKQIRDKLRTEVFQREMKHLVKNLKQHAVIEKKSIIH